MKTLKFLAICAYGLSNLQAAQTSAPNNQTSTPNNQGSQNHVESKKTVSTAPQVQGASSPQNSTALTQNTSQNNAQATAGQPHNATNQNQVSQTNGPSNSVTQKDSQSHSPSKDPLKKPKSKNSKNHKAPTAREVYEKSCKELFYNAHRENTQSQICQKGGLVVGDVNCNKGEEIITDFSIIKLGEGEKEQKENLKKLCYFASGGKVNAKNIKGEKMTPLVINLKKPKDKKEENEETEIIIQSRADVINAFEPVIDRMEKKIDSQIMREVEKASPVK